MVRVGRRKGTRASERAAAIRQFLTPRYFAAAVLAFGLAFVAGAHSLAQATKRPILSIGPIGQYANGRLAQVAGNVRLGEPIRNPDQVAAAARETMALAPLNAPAASLIGLSLAQKGDKAGALKAMTVAIRITRRDPTAQLWLGQEAILKGDNLAQILSRYDLILRTQARVRPAMFTAMAQTLVDAKVRGAMKSYVRADNEWFEGFALAAAEKPATSVGFAQTLLLQTSALPDSVPLRNAYASIVRQIVAERRFDLARQLYPRLPATQPGVLQSAALPRENAAEYAPATWWLVTEPGVGSLMTGRGAGQALELYAANGAGGIAARKMLFLRPGAHRVQWRLLENSTNPGAQMRVVASCADTTGDRVIAEGVVNARVPANGEDIGPSVTAFMDFAVADTGCPALFLDIRTTGGKSRDESRWLLSDMSVAPLRLGQTGKAAR